MKESNEQDKKLYKKFINGDQNAFNNIVEKYRKSLISFIYKLTKDIEIAEDITQEVFVYIYKTKKEYDFKYTLKTYLFTTAKSRAINYLNSQKKEVPLEETNISKTYDDGLDDYLIKKEDKEYLLKNIDTLKEDYKIVIHLRDFEGFSYEEIAEILNKTIPQTKMLFHRARKSLKTKITNDKEYIKNNSLIRIIMNFIIVIIAITGVTYAGMTAYKFIQKETKTDFSNNPDYDDYSEDMEISDGVYYKKITSYQTYLKDLEKWNKLVEMTEDDFNNYFVVVIAGENYNTTGLYISDITTDEENLYIDLNKKNKWDGSTVISSKIEKNLYRDNIVVRNNSNVPDTSNKFVSMEEIPIGYTKEQAIQDGCFVVEYNKIISNDKEKFKKFIENANNGIDGFIRIYQYDIIENITIIDLECKNGKINMSQCNKTQVGSSPVYNSGNYISKGSLGIYWLYDEIGNKKTICNID